MKYIFVEIKLVSRIVDSSDKSVPYSAVLSVINIEDFVGSGSSTFERKFFDLELPNIQLPEHIKIIRDGVMKNWVLISLRLYRKASKNIEKNYYFFE